MKQLRKSILTLLALTLFGGAGAWAQTEENIFQYCYDCQRNPAYPQTTASASLDGFANPLVGYKGSGFDAGNTSDGPWKLEYMGIWSTTNQYGIEDFRVSNYQSIYNCTDVPVFRLYQWNATANEYQHAAYGVVCCYAKVSNAVEHTALFEAADGWGCVLTNSSHSSSMNITFDEDLTTGLTTIIAAVGSGAIELTKSGANQWTLGQTPDYDLELQVEYYEAHALKNIPAGWTVLVNGVDKTSAIDHDSLMITETDSVTLVPAGNPRRVKSVTLADDAPTPLDNTTTAWSAGTYAVPAGGLTYSDAITVSGNVTLVLTDGETLTLNKGISIAEGATLTVEGNGTMNVNGTNNSTASTVAGTGTLVLTSGTLTATGGNGAGGSDMGTGAAGGAAINGTVIVDGGTLTAKGGNGGNVGYMAVQGQGGAGGAAISGSVTVNDGTLTATGGKGGNVGGDSSESHGGAGGAAIGGSLTINAGTMTTTNGAAGSLGSETYGCSGGAAGQAVTGTVTDNR